MTQPNTKIRLIFFGKNLNPDFVTEMMGLEPDTSHKPGDLRRNGKNRHKDGSWELIRLCDHDDFEKQFRHFLDALLLKSTQIEKLTATFDAYVSVSVYGREMAELFIDPDLHTALSSLNIGLNICFQSFCKLGVRHTTIT